jgi:hypothetical protein
MPYNNKSWRKNLMITLENLPANLDHTTDILAFMKATGQGAERDGLDLPSLRVNYNDEDDDGNKIPLGHWSIFGPEGQVFAEEVTLRPMFATYQYSHFDVNAAQTLSTSVHFMDLLQKEVPDSTGGSKCGKLPRKVIDTLSEAEQKEQRDIKLSRVVFGLVTCEGVDRRGKKAKLKDLPCVFYARGTHYMAVSNLLENLFRSRTPMQSQILRLELKREKNKGVRYWTVIPTKEGEVEITADDMATSADFCRTAVAESEAIENKYRIARAKMGNPDMRSVAEAASPDVDLPWDDDIKDVGGNAVNPLS